MSEVKIYHKTHRGCIYKCRSCAKWHLLYKNFQFNMSETELRVFFADIQHEVEAFCKVNNESSPLYFECESRGGMLLNLLKSEYLELEYLIGSSLMLLRAERLLQNA